MENVNASTIMNDMEQLKGIFPDRSQDELRTILCRHNNNLGEAVDAILQGETAVVVASSLYDVAHRDFGNEMERNTPTATEHRITPSRGQPPPNRRGASWWESPTVCTPPLARRLSASAEERRRIMLEAQHLARLKEEANLEAALKASMAPSDKGRLAGHGDLTAGQTITKDALNELMRNPTFVQQLDADLKAAIELQIKLDAEERDKVTASVKSNYDTRNDGSFLVVPASLGVSVRNRLLSVGTSFLKRSHSSTEEQQLVEQLEAINRANEEEQKRREELDRVRREAEAACMQAVKDHLESFLQEKPNGTYEEWIEELHPENAHNGTLLEGMSKTIDHRFYVQDSDHRKLWNDNLNSRRVPGKRQFVHVRQCPAKLHGGRLSLVDLLSDGADRATEMEASRERESEHSPSGSLGIHKNDTRIPPTPTVSGDLISFE